MVPLPTHTIHGFGAYFFPVGGVGGGGSKLGPTVSDSPSPKAYFEGGGGDRGSPAATNVAHGFPDSGHPILLNCLWGSTLLTPTKMKALPAQYTATRGKKAERNQDLGSWPLLACSCGCCQPAAPVRADHAVGKALQRILVESTASVAGTTTSACQIQLSRLC